MRSLFACAIALFLVATLPVQPASAKTSWTVSAISGYQSGQTQYLFDADSYGSELIFPLNNFQTGVDLRLDLGKGERPDWRLRLAGAVGMSDPTSKFTDRDWFMFQPGLEVNFSYSESSVETSFYRLEASVSRRLFTEGALDVWLYAGVQYHSYSFEAVDLWITQLSGLDSAGIPTVVEANVGNIRALTYDVSYLWPEIGPAFDFEISPRVSFSTVLAYTPIFWTDDTDDHLLRNFTLTSDGAGHSFHARSELIISPSGSGLQISAYADYITGKSKNAATQAWYGNDPVNDIGIIIDDTGNSFSGLPHEVSTNQLTVGLRVGRSF